MSQAPSWPYLLGCFLTAIALTFAVIGLLELRDRRREAKADPTVDRRIDPARRGRAFDITNAQGIVWADELARFKAQEQQPAPAQQPLPPIRRSPLVSPIAPGWGRPAPLMPRPVGPEPGTRTQELMRILEEDTLATAVIR